MLLNKTLQFASEAIKQLSNERLKFYMHIKQNSCAVTGISASLGALIQFFWNTVQM